MSIQSPLDHWLSHLFRPTRARRTAEADARILVEAYREWAYQEAGRRARHARTARWWEGERRWSRVARINAQLEGREIGLRTAERYGS